MFDYVKNSFHFAFFGQCMFDYIKIVYTDSGAVLPFFHNPIAIWHSSPLVAAAWVASARAQRCHPYALSQCPVFATPSVDPVMGAG
jgi:hypothetical protein